MYLTSPMSTRNQLGPLLEAWHPGSTGVEIGTHRGDFAKILLDGWPSGTLHCVDPWSIPPGYEAQVMQLWDCSGDRLDDLARAREVMADHALAGRAHLLRMTSLAATEEFEDGSLAFVYIDGDHRVHQTALDIALWWPKVRPGGVLAGHDWMMPGEPGGDLPGGWGRHVQAAVAGFVATYGLDVHLICEEGGLPWSWYCVKPGGEGHP